MTAHYPRRDPLGVFLRLVMAPVALLAAGTLCGSTALAQLSVDGVSTGDRDALYRSIIRDAEVFEREGNLVKRVVRLVRPTVVHIEAAKGIGERFSVGVGQRIDEAGSGVIVERQDKFYVITNLHVISNAPRSSITIKLHDGREITPTRIWSDPLSDVAAMEITASQLIGARMGDSDQMEIGDFVLAVGSPFGLSHSVTYGIISAKGRHDLHLGREGVKFQDFIQTDAAINPGNSGGPLINLRGEVIGINTAIASASGGNEGIGFAIPINMVRYAVDQLVTRGEVSRGFLGVSLDSGFDSRAADAIGLPRLRGARIKSITQGSPAAAAQLAEGDIILQFNGVPIVDDNHLVNVVGQTHTGRSVPVVVFREGERLEVTVKVGVRRNFNVDQ